jgi:hypothetical protein
MTIERTPYGAAREVNMRTIPRGTGRGRWWNLFQDIVRRAERTDTGYALEYPFDDYADAARAYQALTRYFKVYGKDLRACVRCEMGTNDPRLYIYKPTKKDNGRTK